MFGQWVLMLKQVFFKGLGHHTAQTNDSPWILQ